MSCTAQPVFRVNLNGYMTFLCSKCIVENSNQNNIQIIDNEAVQGEVCLCNICRWKATTMSNTNCRIPFKIAVFDKRLKTVFKR